MATRRGTTRIEPRWVFRPRGPLTVSSGQDMIAAVAERLESLPGEVIVDLSDVPDISSWGLAVLCGLAGWLGERGKRLKIASPGPFVKKYVQIFGPAVPFSLVNRRPGRAN